MTVLSMLRSAVGLGRSLPALPVFKTGQTNLIRNFTISAARQGGTGGHESRLFVITPSRYQWQKYKDVLHFYIFLGVIPGLAVVFYSNVFIGPAKLAEVPEGYEPHNWEYYRHPLQRFIARYVVSSYQEDYERNLHYIKEEEDQIKMRKLANKVESLMKERADYPTFLLASTTAGKYIRASKEETDLIYDARGNN